MTIAIRSGVSADAAALAALAARTFHDTFAADNRPEDIALHLTQSYGAVQQGSELVDPQIATLVVDRAGELVGFAQLRRSAAPACVDGPAAIELWRFYIDTAWHGHGIAQSLMQRVHTTAYELGARTLWLGVWDRNERAKAFYRKAGFVDIGSHVFVVGHDAQTDRIMARPIASVLNRGGAA